LSDKIFAHYEAVFHSITNNTRTHQEMRTSERELFFTTTSYT